MTALGRTATRLAAVVVVHVLAVSAALAADPCAQLAGAVSGTVRDADGSSIAGASVRVQGCLGAPQLTDATGAFTVQVPAGSPVIAAAAAGHYDGCWQPPGSQGCGAVAPGASDLAISLDPLPADDDPAYAFQDPSACQTCHADVVDQWNRSTMAHTNGNRWVDNLYNGTDLDMPLGPPPDPNNPAYFGFLSRHNVDAAHPTRTGECANCHQPEYVGSAPVGTNFNAATSADHHGVACDFCHKIVDVDVSAAGIRRPNLVVGQAGLPAKTIMLRSPSQPWLEFGPLDDVTFPGVPYMRASHAPLVASSRLCAACHEDSNDPRDPNGDFLETYTGPESQLTYTEWASSSFAAQGVECQDCHMPSTGADRFCSRTENRRDPSQVRSHEFEGTSPDFLRRAVRLRLGSVVDRATVNVTADLSNVGAGHDVPTGVTLRNLILLITARDRTGATLPQVAGPTVPNWGGAGDPKQGNFAGLPGKGYARVLVDDFLAENVLFTEAVRAFDNRIAAGATDTTHYAFTLPRNWARRDVRITAQLYYRRAFKPIADQRKWNVPRGDNRHGTRGDGSDYDENLVVVETTNALTCKGRFAKLEATVTAGRLNVSASLRLPAHTSFDPGTDGVQLSLGDTAQPAGLLQEVVTEFTRNKTTLTHQGAATEAVASLSLTRAGRRGYGMSAVLADLDPTALVGRGLVFGVDSGEVCFRKALRCKAHGAGVRCR